LGETCGWPSDENYLTSEPGRSTVILLATAKKKATKLAPKLSKTEQDLLQHLTYGYQLEVTSVEGAPVLRRLKDNEIVRPAGVNRNTIRALEERGLMGTVESEDRLTTIWRATKPTTKSGL
jgi:hypothetical protein